MKTKFLICIAAFYLLNTYKGSSQTFTNLAPASAVLGVPGAGFYPGVYSDIDTSIYLLGGDGFMFYWKWIAKYHINSNTWDPTITAPSSIGSDFGYSFGINDKMYFAGGVNGGNVWSSQTWKFDPLAGNSFTQMDDIPAVNNNGRSSGFSFTINNIGYAGEGYGNGNYTMQNDFLSFDPSQASGSQWTTLTPYPGGGDYEEAAVSLNGFGYVGFGSAGPINVGPSQSDFWRYTPGVGGGVWDQMAPFPGGVRSTPMLFTVCNKIILIGGWNRANTSFYDDMWEFDPNGGNGTTGSWRLIGSSPFVKGAVGGRYGCAYANVGNDIYFGAGNPVALTYNDDWVRLNFNPQADFMASPTTVCVGQSLTFTDQSTGNPWKWSWSNEHSSGSSMSMDTTQNPTFFYNTQGQYNVTLMVENVCRDTLKKPLYITVNPGPVVHAVSDTICAGQPAQIAAVPVISGGTYLWTPTGLTDSTISVSPITYTPYTVMYTLAGCNGYDTAKVYVNPTPTIQLSATDSSFCKGNSTTLTATASIPGGTFTWTPAGPNTATNTVSPTTTTLYKVSYTDACATSNTADSLNITVYQLPQAIINSDITSGCVPLCVNFTDASTGVAGTSWNWNFTDSTSTSQNKTHCFKTPGQYDISLKVTTADGCVDSVTNANMITVNALPTADFSAPLTTSLSEPNVSFTDASTGAVTYQWNFGDSLNPATNTSTDPNPIHKYSEVGNYCVTQIVTNASGCSDTTVICLIIDSEFALFIPNSFTPDGDGINDEFYAKGDNIKTFSMLIYDRWGNKIFTSDDITKHWDGKVGGVITQEDTYAYVIDVTDKYNKSHKYIGNINIVK